MDTQIASIVAKKLKDLRKNNRLSEEEVAEHLGISQSTYSRMELGKCNSWALHLESICDLYNIDFDYLVKMKRVNDNKPGSFKGDSNSVTGKLIAYLEARIAEKDLIINELKERLNKLENL